QRLGSGPPAPLLVKRLLGLFLDRDLDLPLGSGVAQNRLDRLRYLGPFAMPRPRRGQFLAQLGQAPQRPLDPLLPGRSIQHSLARTVIPDEAISFDASDLRLVDREAVHQLPLVIVLVVNPSPLD